MDFLLLGPVEVREGEHRLAPGGSKQRALLAILLLNAGEVVSSDRLIEGLWGQEPPATALKMLQVFVSRLRNEIGDAEVIQTRAPGYAATVGPDELDLLRFEALVEAGRSEMTTDPEGAAATLRDALSLWRGPPLSNVSAEPFAQLAIPRLEEMRLSALEDRIDADLAAGRHHKVVAELQDLVAEHPLRERGRGRLMLALYRDGRQAEALQAYREARATLIDELGVEPSRELQQLETAILNQDATLELPGKAARSGVPTPPGRIEGDGRTEPKKRSRWVALVVGLVVLVATVGTAAAMRHDDGAPPMTPVAVARNSIAIVDPNSGTVVGDFAVGTDPGPITASADSAWVGNTGDRTIERIDIATQTPTKTFGSDPPPTSLVYGDGLVWIANGYSGTMSQIIAATNQLSAPFYPVGNVHGQLSIATSPGELSSTGDLWVGLANQDLVKMDPITLQVSANYLLPFKPLALTTDNGIVWSIAFPGFGKRVGRTDPAQGPLTKTTHIPSDPKVLAAGDGAVWVGTGVGVDTRLWKIDPDGVVVGSVGLAANPSAIAVQSGAVWVAGANGTLERIDPTADPPTVTKTVNLGRPIGGMAMTVSGDLWITVD